MYIDVFVYPFQLGFHIQASNSFSPPIFRQIQQHDYLLHTSQSPGCASDDPSHHYQYTHTTNPSWSSVFAPAGEIKQYLNDFIDTNNLRDNIKCGYQICRAEWSEEDSHWKVTIKNKATGQISEEQSEILIDATGIFKYIILPVQHF